MVVGDIEIIAPIFRVQVETLRVDLEFNLTINLQRVGSVPELVNMKLRFRFLNLKKQDMSSNEIVILHCCI